MTLDELIKTLPEGASVLDAGCGPGKILHYITEIRPDLRVRACDVRDTSARLPAGVDFTVGSVEELDTLYAENEFDVIITQHVIEHLLFPMSLMRGCKKVLKPGGLLYVETPNWSRTLLPFYPRLWFWTDYTHVRPFSKATFRRLFPDFEFEIVTMKLFSSTRARSIGSFFGAFIPDMLYIIGRNRK
jgi:SAM-dependent methyltransferase